MEHFYQNIEGWFDFQEIYRAFVSSARNPSHFVEVGAWYGKSSAFMAVEIANSGKSIQFDVVDHWQGSWEHKEGSFAEDKNIVKEGDIYARFLQNLAPARAYINPIRAASLDAAARYPDESLDLVFLDAGHDYADVAADIRAWYPKVKVTGIIAGHDFSRCWPGVIQAVTEFPYFDQSKVIKAGLCWVYHKVASIP
ncbi:MAG: class I SAM-dependent methyltransferase [Deltaproteobacteria bacterium]|nr:class I SAM-dependent methyltransferase [Deltaproteobacteria bacterium]